MNQRQLDWLLGQGITISALTNPYAVQCTADSLYFSDPDIHWNPKTGQYIAADWCLGDPFDRLSDEPVTIHETPLHWLRASRNGIVVIRWECLFPMLFDVPAVSVPASLRDKYIKHMQPARLPEVIIHETIF